MKQAEDTSKTLLVFVLDSIEQLEAGTEGQVWKLLHTFAQQVNFDVHLCLLRDSPCLEHLEQLPFKVTVLGIRRILSLPSWVTLMRYAKHVKSAKCYERAIAHVWLSDALMMGPPVFKCLGYSVCSSRRDLGFWMRPKHVLFLKWSNRFVDLFISNARAVEQCLVQREKIDVGKSCVIYNAFFDSTAEIIGNEEPVDASAASAIGLNAGDVVIGIVANFRPLKRIDMLIEAFARIAMEVQDCRLVIVGDDLYATDRVSMRRDLEAKARSLQVEQRVLFLGSRKDSFALTKLFDIGVLCSETEGLSNSIIEYMHASLPVVCTDIGGNPELVEHEVNGLLVSPNDLQALEEALRMLVLSKAMREKLGAASYRKAKAMFMPDRLEQEMIKAYDSL